MMNELGERLKNLREKKGVTMDKMCEDLSDLYGVSIAKSTISKWENGKAEPTLAYARILTKYFNVTLDYIIGLEDKEETPKKNNQKEIDTIAAHLDDKNITPQKLKLLEQYIDTLFDEF